MADTIKIGNLDISSFKVGSGDCTVYLGTTLLYSGDTTPPTPITHDYSLDYFTIRSLEDGNVITYEHSGYTSSNFSSTTISYSTDSGQTWNSVTTTFSVNSYTLATLDTDETILIKGTNQKYCPANARAHHFMFSKFGSVEGNILSLQYGDNFSSITSIDISLAFKKILYSNTKLKSAENLIVPNVQLSSGCCSHMFSGCTSLETPPELLSTSLNGTCYGNMFNGCTSLTTAPELPATTLSASCYSSMFRNCTSLTTAPQLNATTLIGNCYNNMFNGCTSLNEITCLATDISASICTTNWLNNVSSSGTFIKSANMSSWSSGGNGIPSNWTVQDYSS